MDSGGRRAGSQLCGLLNPINLVPSLLKRVMPPFLVKNALVLDKAEK